MRNNNGFTLIELLAVLTILAIISLIVTPIVLNIIRDSRDSANKRSIESYGRAIENAIADYMVKGNNIIPTDYNTLNQYLMSNGDSLKNYYKGDVVCDMTQINSDGSIYLAECKVNGILVKDFTYGTSNNGTLVLDHKSSTYTRNINLDGKNVKYYYVHDQTTNDFDIWYDTILDDPSLINTDQDNGIHYPSSELIIYHYTPDYEYDYKLYSNNNIGKIIFGGNVPESSKKIEISNYIKDKYKYTSVETN